MNDIEKAMAVLREARRARSKPSPSVAAPAVEADAATSVSDIERSTDIRADVRPHVADRYAGVGQDVATFVAGRPTGARNGFPSHSGPRNVHVGNDEAASASVHVARPRFDDERFADDLLDGAEARRSASMTSARSSVPANGYSSGTDRLAHGAARADTDRAALDMPELGIVTASHADDDELVPDMPELGMVSGLPSRDGGTVSRGSEPDTVASPSAGDHEPNAPDHFVSLPLERLAERGFLTPGTGKGRLSEEFRRVKRPILRNIADAAETDGHRNVVMITSSVTGEGKTYTAINLAISLAAERERTVLLVDADVLKGSAGKVLGIGGRPGLIDVLDDERLDIADVMLATDVPDLRFVPAGRRDDQTTELLSSPRMSALIDELARRYSDRIIVMDCPPMLQTNEANVIADHAGQVVFVVAGEETDQRLVLEAMRRFDENKSVGVLLNRASGSSAAYGYDYGYG